MLTPTRQSVQLHQALLIEPVHTMFSKGQTCPVLPVPDGSNAVQGATQDGRLSNMLHRAANRRTLLQGLAGLRHMDLQGNQLSRLEDLNLLRKYVCCLTHLDLRGNPLSRAPSYTPLTLRRLPHLATLDSKNLGGADWELAAASHGLLTIPLLEECSATRLHSIWSTPGGQSLSDPI